MRRLTALVAVAALALIGCEAKDGFNVLNASGRTVSCEGGISCAGRQIMNGDRFELWGMNRYPMKFTIAIAGTNFQYDLEAAGIRPGDASTFTDALLWRFMLDAIVSTNGQFMISSHGRIVGSASPTRID